MENLEMVNNSIKIEQFKLLIPPRNYITNVSAIAAGSNHTVFLKNDGTVWATGYNNNGELGIGSNTQQNRAVQVTDSSTNPITNVSAIAAGSSHTVF